MWIRAGSWHHYELLFKIWESYYKTLYETRILIWNKMIMIFARLSVSSNALNFHICIIYMFLYKHSVFLCRPRICLFSNPSSCIATHLYPNNTFIMLFLSQAFIYKGSHEGDHGRAIMMMIKAHKLNRQVLYVFHFF